MGREFCPCEVAKGSSTHTRVADQSAGALKQRRTALCEGCKSPRWAGSGSQTWLRELQEGRQTCIRLWHWRIMFQYQNIGDWPKIVLMLEWCYGHYLWLSWCGNLLHSHTPSSGTRSLAWVRVSCGGSPGGRWRAPWSSLQTLQMREVMREDRPLSRHQYAPRVTQQSITTELVSILIPPTAKPLLVTEPQSRAGNIQIHCTLTQTLHSIETYCVLHRKSKSTIKSNVTLSH